MRLSEGQRRIGIGSFPVASLEATPRSSRWGRVETKSKICELERVLESMRRRFREGENPWNGMRGHSGAVRVH